MVYVCAVCKKGIIKGDTFIVYKGKKALCSVVCWQKQTLKDVEDDD